MRGAVLGTLTGVLLAPVIAMVSFLEMLIWPFGLLGMLGDSTWTRLAKGIHERRFRPLLLPLLVFVVLPMTLCGLGGSRLQTIGTPTLVSAALGAIALGMVLGGICASRLARLQQGGTSRWGRAIDSSFLPPKA